MRTYDIVNAGPRNRFMANGRIVSNSGRSIQLQNLPQNHLSTLDEAREMLKLGAFDSLEMIYGNTPDVLSQLIRTMLIPRTGCEFVVADFSAIEARVLAWLAGEQWRLDSFRSGADIYCASASQMFGVPVVKNGINGHLRQKGKVAELACISEGQLVLTSAGYRPIQAVTRDMLVWDGVAWVRHDGVVRRGIRRTMTFEGLTATPDHLIWNGYRFIPFEYYAAMRDNANGGRNIFYSGLRPVYDIKNCGSRHQFMVSGHIVHNCGYGGASGALIAMGALDMGLKEVDLPDLIRDWRASNPRIVQFWWDVDKAATNTVKTGNLNRVGLITFERYAGELFITLPSGRKLAYASPRLEPNKFGRMGITYMGIGTNNKWQRLETYGPKIVENCLSGDALIITSKGLKRLDEITENDSVWDGLDFVQHRGLISRGVKKTVSVGGLHMTPDHKILTKKGWMPCEQAQGLNWHEVVLPYCLDTCQQRKTRKGSMAMPVRLRKSKNTEQRTSAIKIASGKVVRLYDAGIDFKGKLQTRHGSPSGVWSMAFDEATLRGFEPSSVSQLWCPWHSGLSAVEKRFRSVLERYGTHVSNGIGVRSNGQQQRVFSRKLPLGFQKSKQSEPTLQPCNRYTLWKNDSSVFQRTHGHWCDNNSLQSESQVADRITVRETGREECVYDIRNCGPRHRFAVWDEQSGKSRIVSNCTQAIARDLLAEAMLRVNYAGYDIVLHVHDEMCVEAPAGTLPVERLCEIMSVNPSWAEGLPLAAAGYCCPYYQKD